MQLDHFNLAPQDLEGMKDFLCRVLGLEVGDRPNFNFPGYWLYGGGNPIIHLNSRMHANEPTTGVIDHLAFLGDDHDAMVETLEREGLSYKTNLIEDTGVRQLFFYGPEGVKIEVAFRP